MRTLPVISLTKLKYLNGSQSGNEEHKSLYNICLEHGFLYLKYHGIYADLVQKTIDSSRNFFQLPKDIKEDYGQDKQTVYPNTSSLQPWFTAFGRAASPLPTPRACA
ncbi:MAG: hypothetical protein F6K26_44315 [Moorea sp. SIO2I5]|nr:hypothetical protein [Moorena sp. SIO2I5]